MPKNGIDALVCIGGDGTFTGAKIFRRIWRKSNWCSRND